MATIKSFSDLSQSKKLAEILPLESADMYFQLGETKYADTIEASLTNRLWERMMPDIHPCWSLASLLGVLPNGTRLLKSTNISYVGDTKYYCDCPKSNIDKWFDNPVDACVAIIEILHELNLL